MLDAYVLNCLAYVHRGASATNARPEELRATHGPLEWGTGAYPKNALCREL